MSSCQGAPAPHLDCDYGAQCDWDPKTANAPVSPLRPSIPGELTVSFGRAPRGRVTGWAVACSVHGAMPVLAPARAKAREMAGLHLVNEHGGRGVLKELARA